MTRNGKIARLPQAIHQQLNLRLQNGELAQDLLLWLNHLPEVQAILAAHFAAKPIDESNLSHWKQSKRNRSASVKSLASVRSTAPAPPRKACFHRNPNLIELN